jgi:REP element-mobilizing transposase RayT
MIRKRHVQLTLDHARRSDPGHGGWRRGAGRPSGRKDVEHGHRPDVRASCPQHITLRVVDGVALRKEWMMPTIHAAIRDSERDDFRVVEFSVLGNHLHAIVETGSADALASGMNGLEVRLARRLNRKLKRRGKLFAGRYHVRALRTPTEVRNALRYVLLNARHHAAERGESLNRGWFDPYSSAAWFAGWSAPLRGTEGFQRVVLTRPRPNARARTWLLAIGWRSCGLLSVDEVPGKVAKPLELLASLSR